MKTISYQKLIDSKNKYISTIERLGLKNQRNRWIVAYELVAHLEEARLLGKLEEIDDATLGRMRFALTDLDNMLMILVQFEGDTTPLFKKKFKEMLGGADSQVDEIATGSSSLARNTQFELMMCARFKEIGLDARLCDPNPDILVRVNGRSYGFECKRIFSTTSRAISEHVEKAISQLNERFLDDDYSKRGMPLLGIDRHITGGDKILVAKDEESARRKLGDEIEQFDRRYSHLWKGMKKSQGERLIGVMIYINMTTSLESESMQVVSRHFGASNSGWTRYGRQMFNEFIGDMAQFLGPLSITERK